MPDTRSAPAARTERVVAVVGRVVIIWHVPVSDRRRRGWAYRAARGIDAAVRAAIGALLVLVLILVALVGLLAWTAG